MACLGVEMRLILAVAATLWIGATAQSACTSALLNLSPCLSYVTGNAQSPASECCRQLGSLAESQPQCLCEALSLRGTSVAANLNINETLALGLPSACRVQTPPLSSCKVAGSPTTSPSGAPDLPSTLPSPTGRGSETTPTDSNSAAGSSAKLSMTMLFFLLSASYASTFSMH